MGAGIAQVACLAGFETRLHDPVPEALERGSAAVRRRPRAVRGARPLVAPRRPTAALARLHAAPELEELARCELVIEAAPEDLELKRRAVRAASREICGPEAVLATNTSSLPVTALASAAARPERVVGHALLQPGRR